MDGDSTAFRLLEWVTRLFGVTLVGVGVLFTAGAPVVGVPVAGFGLLLAVRPATGAEVLDILADLL